MKTKTIFRLCLLILFSLVCVQASAKNLTLPALTIDSETGTQSVSVSLQVLLLFTALTLLPAIILTMTSFTRIIIVLAILRQALGMPQTPSNQILIGLALFMTLFIMTPTFTNVYDKAVLPYMNENIEFEDALLKAKEPVATFMLNQTRSSDLNLFSNLANTTAQSPNELSMAVILPAFITSELKTAFQIGFLIFIPFLIIDLVVASVLMSMGMMMLSPLIISLPFKIMLFVLVDGWALITGTLAGSFG